jgi:hypothetical protein
MLAKDLLKQILVRDPSERIGVKSRKGHKSIREHGWLSGIDYNGILSQKVLPPWVPPSKDLPTPSTNTKKEVPSEDIYTGDPRIFEGW